MGGHSWLGDYLQEGFAATEICPVNGRSCAVISETHAATPEASNPIVVAKARGLPL